MAQEPSGRIWQWALGLANECVTRLAMRGSANERGARMPLADDRENGGERGARLSPNAMDSMRVPGDAMASTWLARKCHRSGIPVVL